MRRTKGASLATRVGDLALSSCVMTAAGTSGHGDELAAYGPLESLGAVVVKSLSAAPWPGNPAPRLAPLEAGMLNSVGLQGPGLEAWLADDLPRLRSSGAKVVVSIWGRSLEEYRRASSLLVGHEVDAVEINVSCPNLEDRSRMFAHSATATAEVVAAVELERPRWVKLSPNTPELTDVAHAAMAAGADALVVANTVLGMVIDIERRQPALGGGGGGLSGPAIHPVAVRAVFECHRALPEAPIIGVGGVQRGVDAIELLQAGASAVQVGTASLAEPRAPWRIMREIEAWMVEHGVSSIEELVGVAHG
jgi:dihydroorotate dehydrogenase (NAD+) catalytic subunit